MTAPPRWLERLTTLILRVRFGRSVADEVLGDLAELWSARHAAGRRDLRRAWVRDAIGTLARRATAPSAGSAPRRRVTRPGRAIGELFSDARIAVRGLSRRPLFASVAVLTLALGIAASTTIFALAERILLRPLPYPDPASLVVVENPPFTFGGGRMDIAPGVLDLGVLSGAGIYAEGGVNLDGAQGPVRIDAAVASPGFFEAMAVRPTRGRVYTAAEQVDGADNVAVISDGLWRRLGADPSVVDTTLVINARPFRVLGVMPAGFTFPSRTDVWLPVFADRQVTGQAFAPVAVARLAPRVAAADAERALQRWAADRAGESADRSDLRLVALHATLTSRARPIVLLLSGAVALLLLVACANVAGLMLSRVANRQAELALRSALGGSRWRLARLLLAESLSVSLAAGLIGTAVAAAALAVLPRLMRTPLPGLDAAALDVRLLAIGVVMSVGTGVVFGLAPGLAAARLQAARVVRTPASAGGPAGWHRLRASLVIVEIAMATVLLFVTGATVQTIVRLSTIELGFGSTRATALEVTLPLERYGSPEQVAAFYRDASARLEAVPGITRVAATGIVPGDGRVGVGLRLVPDGATIDEGSWPFATMLFASPGYFEVMGIPLLAGRTFDDRDARGSTTVVVLSASEARALWPDGQDPIGRMVRLSGPGANALQVVGVVGDVRLDGPESDRPLRQFYRPLLQSPPFGAMTFVIDSDQPPAALLPAVRDALADVDAGLPVYDARAVEDIATSFLGPRRATMSLMGALAAVALLLAAVGLYGMMAEHVTQRRREIGIRMALGADPARLQTHVVAHGARLTVAGLLVGAMGAYGAARVLASVVPSMDAPGLLTVGANGVVLLAASLAAAWLPARRAASIDPLVTLRE